MVEQPSIAEKEVVFLTKTKDTPLEQLLSNLIGEKNIRFNSEENCADLQQQRSDQIITFIIGSDIEDPVQCTQRLHALNEKAKIILLSKSENNLKSLKEAIKFSPFIGVDVFCFNELKKTELTQKLDEILRASYKADNYRTIIEETNANLKLKSSSQKPALNRLFFNKLLNIAPIGITIMNQEGKILGWNKEAASIFGINEAQALGTLLPEYFEPAEGKRLQNYIRLQSSETKQKSLINQLSLERTSKDSTKQFLSLTAAPLSHSETEQALILVIEDITERTQAKIELQEINKTLEERVKTRTAALESYQDQLRSLVSELSKAEEQERQRLAAELHDNLGQILAMGKMKADQVSQSQDKDSVGIDELRELLEDAIAYTRELMSELKPPPSLQDEALIKSIEWISKKMDKHGLEVTIEDDEQPKPLSNEIQRTLIQFVRELLFNVIQHASVYKAHIKVNRINQHVTVSVEDEGIGFDTNKIEYIPAEKKGFGLFKIRERIELLGGIFEIDSELGAGTKVTLHIPLV